MAAVLARLEDYLDIPTETLFSKEQSERLLFDDTRFTRTKKYHWAMQWLGKMSKCMGPMIREIEEMEQNGLPFLRDSARKHKIRTGVSDPKGKDLVTEKSFHRKAARAREVRDRIEAKIEEVKDLRDALVNASGVLESRAAVSQADTVYTLTVLMLIYLPVTTVIGVFSMGILPHSSQTLKAFGISMCSVFFATCLLAFNLGSVLTLVSIKTQRVCRSLQQSMYNVGPSWKKRSHDLKDISEAELLIAREKRIPVAWFYTWYALIWIFMCFPSQELREVGGIMEFIRKTRAGGSEGQLMADGRWIWNGVMIPLRVLLLPLHAVTLFLDYILLVVFSESLVGRVEHKEKEDDDDDSDDEGMEDGKDLTAADYGQKQTYESIALVNPDETPKPDATSVSPWKTRFTKPVAILKEFSHLGLGAAGNQEKPVPEPPIPTTTSQTDPPPNPPTEVAEPATEPTSLSLHQSFVEIVTAAHSKLEQEAQGNYSDEASSCESNDDSDDDDDDDEQAEEENSENEDGIDGEGSDDNQDRDDDGSGEEKDDKESTSSTTPLRPTASAYLPTIETTPALGSFSGIIGGIMRGGKSEERDLERGP
ncbi:hypothetical protein K440DRAFT_239876 [Wilcoxina mikolae CBS 423.85]|nr:hypothetical protein K440DRAFT_239876 [Wilcoxina mikolae CBS 423.85]